MLIDKSCGSLADCPFLEHELLFLLIDMTVTDIRADRNSPAVGAVKFVLLLERGKVLPYGNLGNLQALRQIRNGDTALQLQDIQNRLVPFGQ